MPKGAPSQIRSDMREWNPLRFHRDQQAFFRDAFVKPKVLAAAGRRSGKTVLARRKLALLSMLKNPYWSDPRALILSPSVLQTKRVWFEPMQRLLPAWAKADVSVTDMRIITTTGCELLFGSIENIARYEGAVGQLAGD